MCRLAPFCFDALAAPRHPCPPEDSGRRPGGAPSLKGPPVASVTLRDIKKTYDQHTHVIQGVDLEIQDGEFLVLVGPSGCGKSTLLRMIAGLEDISQGDLHIAGRRVNDVPPKDRGIGMVFQSYALYPHMTVFENMAFGLKIRKVDAAIIRQRVEEASALLDLDAHLERHPKELSGGQRQRVAIGRAIVRQPDVFLFDEPLSNLDAALRTQMRIELKRLHQRLRSTMIYVTHDKVEAMTLADRIAIVHQGRLQQVGRPEEVFERPHNLFVATFIGSPSMNVLQGTYTEGVFTAAGLELGLAGVPAQTDVACVGVRPQHLALCEASSAHIHAVVDVLEPMGWEAHVHLTMQGQPLTLHAHIEDASALSPGDAVHLRVQEGKAHVFDQEGVRVHTC